MWEYDILTGKNTVLRGLIAEEAASYLLKRKLNLIIFRTDKILKFIRKHKIKTNRGKFIRKYKQTMDFFGIYIPEEVRKNSLISLESVLLSFFTEKEDLRGFIGENLLKECIKGYVIEIKSRVTNSPTKSFNFSFSENQQQMIKKLKNHKSLDLLVVGITMCNNWIINATFFDKNLNVISKIL